MRQDDFQNPISKTTENNNRNVQTKSYRLSAAIQLYRWIIKEYMQFVHPILYLCKRFLMSFLFSLSIWCIRLDTEWTNETMYYSTNVCSLSLRVFASDSAHSPVTRIQIYLLSLIVHIENSVLINILSARGMCGRGQKKEEERVAELKTFTNNIE